MKYFAMALLVVISFLVIAQASAQVYVPGPGYPLCYPQTVATPQGITTVIVCQ